MPSNEALANDDMYYWWSFPVGLIINKPVSNCWSLGCEVTFDLMFSGGVQALVEVEDDVYEIGSTDVSLSNHCGYRLELYADGLLTENFFIQFAPYLNYYRFGKSNSGYPPINESGVANANNKIPSECTTIMADTNITFTILKSGIAPPLGRNF